MLRKGTASGRRSACSSLITAIQISVSAGAQYIRRRGRGGFLPCLNLVRVGIADQLILMGCLKQSRALKERAGVKPMILAGLGNGERAAVLDDKPPCRVAGMFAAAWGSCASLLILPASRTSRTVLGSIAVAQDANASTRPLYSPTTNPSSWNGLFCPECS